MYIVRRLFVHCLSVLSLFMLTGTMALAQPVDRIAERQRAVETGLLPAVVLEGRDVPTYSLQQRMTHYGIPGVSLAVINDGIVEWADGYGVLRSGTTDSVTVSTLFQAASISKPIAALAALRLVDDGRLELDQDVNKYLRSWRVPENEYTAVRPVTLRHLLSHSAGVTVSGFPGYERGASLPTAVEVIEGDGNTAPVRVDTIPGASYRYSGGGSTVVQVLIEDVCNASFERAVERLVLDPLGMYRSTFAQPLPPRLHNEAASGHRDDAVPIPRAWRVYPEKAAAGLWSTPTDLARFAIGVRAAYLGEEGSILDGPLAQEMLTLQNEVYGLGPGVFAAGDSLWFGHAGGNAGFRAFVLLYPTTGDGVAVMTNGDNGHALNHEIIRSVSRVYGWTSNKPEVRTPVRLSAETLDQYTGTYQFDHQPERAVHVDRIDHHLRLSWLNDRTNAPQRLEPTSTNEFVMSSTGASVVFEVDEPTVRAIIDGWSAQHVE